MNKLETLKAIEGKVMALDAQVAAAKEADKDKSVGRLKRQSRALKVISELITKWCPDEFKLDLEDDLLAMIEARKGKTLIKVHEGDSYLELCSVKYPDVIDIVTKINKQMEHKGLVLDGATGLIIKQSK